jgi:Bacterial dnaA protein helix-turn-helix
MGTTPAPPPAETLVQLVLRARHLDELVQNEGDWRALGTIAARTLFWCGGAMYACRCEGNEMRFALTVVHASLGTIAHQIAGAYATRLRKTRYLSGTLFEHYAVIPLKDVVFLDELVFWLHRAADLAALSGATTAEVQHVWTADSAYLVPHSLPWIDTDRVLTSLSVGAPGPAAYRRRKSEPIPESVLEYFTRRPTRALPKQQREHTAREPRPAVEMIARIVAAYCKVSYEDMLGNTRKRSVSRARVIAAVLATRNGATAAAAARLFNRSRSTLIEQVEHYRATQPEIFAEAESLLEVTLAKTRE